MKFESILPEWKYKKTLSNGRYVIENTKKENSILQIVPVPYYEDIEEKEVRSRISDRMTKLMELTKSESFISIEYFEIVKRNDGFGWDLWIRMEYFQNDFLTVNSENFLSTILSINRALIECENHNILHKNINRKSICINKNGEYKLGNYMFLPDFRNSNVAPELVCPEKNVASEIYQFSLLIDELIRMTNQNVYPDKNMKMVIERGLKVNPNDRQKSFKEIYDVLIEQPKKEISVISDDTIPLFSEKKKLTPKGTNYQTIYDIYGGYYEGEVTNNVPHGHGIYHYANKSTYEGEWHNGKRHGKGVMTYQDGLEKRGLFQEGKFVAKQSSDVKKKEDLFVKEQIIESDAEIDSLILEKKISQLKHEIENNDSKELRESLNILQNEIGNEIVFGNQKWILLNKRSDSALLLLKKSIGKKFYHKRDQDITWENCSLRKWLNTYFFENNFLKEDRCRIKKVMLDNGDNKEYGTPGGNITEDYIFLLSEEEVEKYYSNKENRILEKSNTEGYGKPWLLRTPGKDLNSVCLVWNDGSIFNYGLSVSAFENWVRPALWIKI